MSYRPNISNINNFPIIVFIGDSTAHGNGLINSYSDGIDPKYMVPSLKLFNYYKPDRTSTNNGNWELYDPTIANGKWNSTSGYARPTSFPYEMGPDAGFMYRMQELGNQPFLVIKWALGGTRLIGDWLKSNNYMYQGLIDYSYKIAMQKLQPLGVRNPVVKIVDVCLVTNDVSSTDWNAATFSAGIQQINSDLRKDFNNPLLNMFWTQVRTDLSTTTAFPTPPTPAKIAEAQACINNCQDISNPAYIKNFTVFNGFQNLPLQSDIVHYTSQSYIDIGITKANTFYPLL